MAGNSVSPDSTTTSLSSTTPSICTVNGNTINSLAAGTCTIAVAFHISDATVPIYNIIAGSTLNLAPSWNLLGNSIAAPLDVAATFGDANNVISVWKWIPATSQWAFYTPSQTDGGAAYATTKGYVALTTINGGEGFWVNAKTSFSVQMPTGTTIGASCFRNQADTTQNKLVRGWNLICTGDNMTPSAFNLAISEVSPAQGVIPTNVTTLWAWDSALSSWYFYAPSLEANGTLVNYIASKSYLDFTANNKTLGQGVGFWVNKP